MKSVARVLLVLLLAAMALGPAAMVAPAAAVEVSRTLQALARDVGAAQAHAAALRERLALDLATDEVAVQIATDEGAEIAGIADGGVRSSLVALRLVARAVDRRLEGLRRTTTDELSPERAEVMLALRSSLAEFRWTIERMPSGPEADAETRATRERRLARLEAALAELDYATAAMASFDWAD